MKAKSILVLVLLTSLCSAEWKSDANDSIDLIRKSKASITVKTPTGQTAQNVKVKIRQKKHKFAFGSELGNHLWRDYRYGQFFIDNLEWATIRTNWIGTEPTQGQVSYEAVDKLVEFCEKNGLQMRGHRVCSDQAPDSWIGQLNYDNNTPPGPELRNALESRFDSAINHFKGKFAHWDVYNEMAEPTHTFFSDRLDSGDPNDPNEPIRAWMYKQARRIDPNVSLFINEYSLLTSGPNFEPYSLIPETLDLIDFLRAYNAPIDAIGAQSHFFNDWGIEDVNALDVTSRIDQLSVAGFPIWVTEFHCEDANTVNRAKELEDFYITAFSHPSIDGIIMWGFWAPAVPYEDAAIIDSDWFVNPAGQKFLSLLNEWTTEIDDTTDANGKVDFSGFHGEYEIVLEPMNCGSPTIYDLCLDEPETIELWSDDYEDYSTGISWYTGTDWSRIPTYKADTNSTYTYNSGVTTSSFGSNSTKKLSGYSYNYGAWHARAIGDYNSSDDIIVTGQVAVKDGTHSTWPVACHIWVGGIALGISGDNISYGRLEKGSYVAWNYPSTPPFTSITKTIDPNIWYDLMIVYHQNSGNDNDTADLYYKKSGEGRWINIIKGYQANADITDSNDVGTVFCNGAYFGFIDNLTVSKKLARCEYEFTLDMLPDIDENYESYSTGTNWYSGSDWIRLQVTKSDQTTYYYNAAVASTTLGDNSTKKLSGSSYNYGAWHAHDIGSYNDYDILELTAQVAVKNTSTHSTWPIACHIWLGGVALGLSGDNISYGQIEEARYIYTNEPSTPPFTTLESASIDPNVWYDLKILYRQIDGNNNDLADLYYRKSSDTEWTCIVTDFHTGSDARDSNSFCTVFCNDATYPGCIDNICLQVVAPDEDYEGYPVNDSSWYVDRDWSRLQVTKSDQTTYYYDARVDTTLINGNTSQKLRGRPYNYGAWHAQDINYYTSKDDIVVTAQAAVAGSTHSAWPVASHIWVGGVAVGISGNKISYGRIDEGSYIYINEPTSPPFTASSIQITADKWYDLKIEYHQINGNGNDVADLYYKEANSPDWIAIVKDFESFTDITASNRFATIFCNNGTNDGYIDNVRCEIRPSLYRIWTEDFDDYDLWDQMWYYPTFWTRHIVTKPDQTTTYYNTYVVDTTIGSNTSAKQQGRLWNYGSWSENKILDSWVIGKITELEEATLTGQIALLGPYLDEPNEVNFPSACHIWMGNVGIGMSGSLQGLHISYGQMEEGKYIVQNSDPNFNWTQVWSAPVDPNIWYDVKIVYHQIDGFENDKADFYYKDSNSSDWITIATDCNTASDLGDSVDTVFTNGYNVGHIDNLRLTTRRKD